MLICSNCNKELTEDDIYKIEPAISISPNDFKVNYKRDREYVCCGRFRMHDRYAPEKQYDYEIPFNVKIRREKGDPLL